MSIIQFPVLVDAAIHQKKTKMTIGWYKIRWMEIKEIKFNKIEWNKQNKK